MQRTELNFIITGKLKEDKQFKPLMKFPCGLRQHDYNMAYKKAQDTIKILEDNGLQCRLITKYLKTYVSSHVNQLQIIGV